MAGQTDLILGVDGAGPAWTKADIGLESGGRISVCGTVSVTGNTPLTVDGCAGRGTLPVRTCVQCADRIARLGGYMTAAAVDGIASGGQHRITAANQQRDGSVIPESRRGCDPFQSTSPAERMLFPACLDCSSAAAISGVICAIP